MIPRAWWLNFVVVKTASSDCERCFATNILQLSYLIWSKKIICNMADGTNVFSYNPSTLCTSSRGGTRDFLTREREYVFFPKNTVRPSLPIFVMFVSRRCQTQSMLHTPVEHGLNASSSSRQHCNITHRSTSPPYRSKRSLCIDSNAGSSNVPARGQC